ncbi:MAG: type II toxin-antitoxin system VapC family toxin [Caulobacter sp.]|nr:type II toxin-antitoxin system VapC family toxin [Caulobacter sp.]
MIAVDASALCAICLQEPDGAHFEDLLLSNPEATVSALNLWEARVTVARRLPEALPVLERLIEAGDLRIAPIGAEELEMAWQAWKRFGKGRHPAALNMGDCFAYATAKAMGCALLYKGNDFALTDIETV